MTIEDDPVFGRGIVDILWDAGFDDEWDSGAGCNFRLDKVPRGCRGRRGRGIAGPGCRSVAGDYAAVLILSHQETRAHARRYGIKRS